MDGIRVQGGRRLKGTVEVSGAKNAALPLVFSSLLTDQTCHYTGVPDVADIRTATKLLQSMGAGVETPAAGELLIDCSTICEWEAPYDLVRTMRASFLVLGPLVARFGRARVSKPGGCAIGARPVDLHLAALARLGVRLETVHGYEEARTNGLRGAQVILNKPSVGATENVVMAASLAEGTTRIENAAREPEVIDLIQALRAMGANIRGEGTSVIEVEGVQSLGGLTHRVIPDRIEAGTLLIAAAITAGDVLVRGARPGDLEQLLDALGQAGASVSEESDGLRLRCDVRPSAVDIRTAPHPGFATDLQAQFMALMCFADGRSTVTETIFENRFMHVGELQRMGAEIELSGNSAVVTGQVSLSGAHVMATDLRASVSLVLAGLAAEYQTDVLRVYHLDRGYENIEAKLRALGADVQRVKMSASP
ncbi:MAG: UDP-N-acetylglucosamine 1-carboxyvinyltransferase [Candidatus Binatia bacterium]